MPDSTTSSPPPNRKLRWYQFSLRSLLIFVTLFAVACSWFTVKWRQAQKQKEVVEAIQELGGLVHYRYEVKKLREEGCEIIEPPVPLWLRNWLGDDFFSDVIDISMDIYSYQELEKIGELPQLQSIDICESRLTDSDLKILGKLSNLRFLKISGAPITGEGVKYLEDLPQLESLGLSPSNITASIFPSIKKIKPLRSLTIDAEKLTDNDLLQLSDCTQLESLSLTYNHSISDAGIEHLLKLVHLKKLELPPSGEITDVTLKHLENLHRLEKLSLSRSSITDAGMKHLANLHKLESLDLSQTMITGSTFAELEKLPKLQTLNLSYTKVTDGTMMKVAKLRNLDDLEISNTHITDKGVKHLTALSELTSLNLSRTKISDKALVYVSEMKKLRYLDLSGDPNESARILHIFHDRIQINFGSNNITILGLKHLRKMRNLDFLDISDTFIGTTGIRKMRAALPNCFIRCTPSLAP